MPEPFVQINMGDNEYLIKIKLSTVNLSSELEIENVVVDTGFTNDIFLPMSFKEDLEAIGFRLYDLGPEEALIDAFGDEVSGDDVLFCIARLRKIQEQDLSEDLTPVQVLLCGTGDPLIGLNTLNNWTEEFNGLEKVLTFFGNE